MALLAADPPFPPLPSEESRSVAFIPPLAVADIPTIEPSHAVYRPRPTTRCAAVANEFPFPYWLTVKEELASSAVPPGTPDPPMPPATKYLSFAISARSADSIDRAFDSNKIDCPLRIKSNMGPVNRKPTQQQARMISTRRQSAQGAQFGGAPLAGSMSNVCRAHRKTACDSASP